MSPLRPRAGPAYLPVWLKQESRKRLMEYDSRRPKMSRTFQSVSIKRPGETPGVRNLVSEAGAFEERDHSGTEQCLAAADVFWEIVDHHSLVDVWRDHHPDDVSTFTFVQVEAHRLCHSWLDHIYLSHFHLSQAHSSSIRPAPFSDHHLATVMANLRREAGAGLFAF
ncbi:unnamed protein product [Caretta caretta]